MFKGSNPENLFRLMFAIGGRVTKGLFLFFLLLSPLGAYGFHKSSPFYMVRYCYCFRVEIFTVLNFGVFRCSLIDLGVSSAILVILLGDFR